MICDCEVYEIDVIKTVDKVSIINLNLTSIAFNLMIIFFIIFIIYASIALLKIR